MLPENKVKRLSGAHRNLTRTILRSEVLRYINNEQIHRPNQFIVVKSRDLYKILPGPGTNFMTVAEQYRHASASLDARMVKWSLSSH